MERFKIRVRIEGQICFDEVEGEEVFQINGFRFFSHRYGTAWRVSDARAGVMVTESPFYDDAVKTAKERISKNFDWYINILKTLKKVPRTLWRYRILQ